LPVSLFMSSAIRLFLALFVSSLALTATFAENAANVIPHPVPFSSEEGMTRLARSSAKMDFPVLANQFEAQSNPAFCGPTSAAIVLNAVYGRRADLPRDRSRMHEGDLRYVPPNIEPTLPRFTQDNVITQGLKTRAQVLGEPLPINGKQVTDFGYQIRQLDEMIRANGVSTKLTIVDENKIEDEIRTELVENLKRRGDYVIVSFLREAVGERGGSHISPLGAYDTESDSFLVLDVNPASADWVWMPTKTLINGMRTFDKIENRGYIQVAPP
jgi:Phytochelatin synthase